MDGAGRVVLGVLGAALLGLFVFVWGAAFVQGFTCDAPTTDCGDQSRGYFVLSVMVAPALPAGLWLLYGARALVNRIGRQQP